MEAIPSQDISLQDYLALVPSDEETARRAVRPFYFATFEIRWKAFAELLREMDAISLGEEYKKDTASELFWHHWTDPAFGLSS